MRFKGFTQLTPLIIGLIAGMIVAGLVAAWTIYETKTLGGKGGLVIETSSGVSPSGVSPDETPDKSKIIFCKGDECGIDTVDFGEVGIKDTVTQTVTIENTSEVDTQIIVKGINYSPNETRWHGKAENGLDYYYGVYFPESCFDGEGEEPQSYPYSITLNGGDQKEIELSFNFPDQEITNQNSTIVNFEYKFGLGER